MRHIGRAGALSAMALIAAAAVAEDLYGVSFANSQFTLIDSATGSGSSVAPLGRAGFNSLEQVGSTFYATTFILGGATDLYTWTLGSPTATLVGATEDIRGLAYDGSTMWGVRNNAGTDDDLVTIDVSTGAVTLVGATGFTGVQALAVSAAGIVAWDITAGLLNVNSATGAATAVGNTPNIDVQGMDFGLGGTLFGGREELYSINTTTGATTLIGSGGYADLRGIATDSVPEPSTLIAVLTGGLLLLSRRRK